MTKNSLFNNYSDAQYIPHWYCPFRRKLCKRICQGAIGNTAISGFEGSRHGGVAV